MLQHDLIQRAFAMHAAFADPAASIPSIPILFATEESWPTVRQSLGEVSAFAHAGFEPKPGQYLLLPGGPTGISAVLFGLPRPPDHDPFWPGRLPSVLPAGVYRFGSAPPNPRLAALGFALGTYRFSRYRRTDGKRVQLALPADLDGDDLTRMVDAVVLARDLINTPANDLGPAELEEAGRALARRHDAQISVIVGDDLLEQNFPLIHAVGRASVRPPRLIDICWGDPRAPKVTLVGKGVTFDTGGLDLKPESGMLIMKKDMGGAACVLALAHMVMDRGLRVRLRVLIPAVENAVSGSAFRPLDVYRSRKGLTVEIGNTDAEGRLVLADALALADEEAPALIVDLATLTGAARVALGPDVAAFYTADEPLAADLTRFAVSENDPLWRLPLWQGYASTLESPIADLRNAAPTGFAGSITAALFLQRFVAQAARWIHVDLYAWTPSAKAGRPEGGECQAARALYALLQARYGP